MANLRIPLIVAGSLAGIFFFARAARASKSSSSSVDGVEFPKLPNRRVAIFTDGQKMFEALRDKRLPTPPDAASSEYTPNWDALDPAKTLVIVGDNDRLMSQALSLAAQAVSVKPPIGGSLVTVLFASCAVADEYARAEGYSEFQIGAGGDCQTLIMYRANDIMNDQAELKNSADVITNVPAKVAALQAAPASNPLFRGSRA